MKLSDIKDEKALDVLADIIEPANEIFSDEEVKEASEKSKAKAISIAIKKHKKEVIAIMAALDDVPIENYHFNILTVPIKILSILNDPELEQLFI